MKKHIIQEKSFVVLVGIIETYKELQSEKEEFLLSKQLLRCGTSLVANLGDAVGAQSQNDFLEKLAISHKEVCETRFWLQLLEQTNFLTKQEVKHLVYDIEDLVNLLSSILITTKYNHS